MMFRGEHLKGLIVLGAWVLPTLAHAGAWNAAKGDGLVILKYEPLTATEKYDLDGGLEPLLRKQKDNMISLWGEYGLTDRVNLIVKTDWQDSQDEYNDFEGRGLLEVGLRYQLYRKDRSAIAVQAVYADDGEGRNAGWADPGEGKHETELRLLAGHSFASRYPTFIEGQLARRWRDGLSDETRYEVTMGVDISPKWTVIGQAYMGKVDDTDAEWTKLEAGVIRHVNHWSLQAGWRFTSSGRQIVNGDGVIVALWRRF